MSQSSNSYPANLTLKTMLWQLKSLWNLKGIYKPSQFTVLNKGIATERKIYLFIQSWLAYEFTCNINVWCNLIKGGKGKRNLPN